MSEHEEIQSNTSESGLTEEATLFDVGTESSVEEKNTNINPQSDGFSRIPDRTYFRIGDVAEITGIKAYVLRFWETEFSILQPTKNSSGQRVYEKRDVESVILIKRLLYKERYSIEGAKNRIKEMRREKKLSYEKSLRGALTEEKFRVLESIRSDLCKLIDDCEEE